MLKPYRLIPSHRWSLHPQRDRSSKPLWRGSPGHWAGRVGLHRPAVLTIAAALVSNLVSNVPAVLLFKPLIPTLGEPNRAWLILAMSTTLAGNLTLIGSVANLIVVEDARAARVDIGFLEYCRVGVPLTVVTLLIGWLVLTLVAV